MHRPNRFRALWTLVPVLALSLDLAAQKPKPTTRPKSGREKIVEEVEERSKRFREGRVIQSHVRVTVNLVNGNRMAGVVKNGRFVERHDGLRFTQAAAGDSRVGIRLWYSDQTNSYIFLPFSSIKRYRIGERLSDEQVKSLGEAFQKAAAERAALARAQAEKRKAAKGGSEAPGAEGQPGGGKPGEKPEAKGPTLTDAQKELLQTYPPSDGWGEGKLKELERRQIVIGVFPNAVEKRFIDNFAAWSEAVRVQQEIEEYEKAKKIGASGTPVGGPPTPAPAKGSGPVLTPPGTGGPKPGTPATGGSGTTGSKTTPPTGRGR